MACVFCSIAKGDIPSVKLYEDERVLAFLDIHPLRRGHALVIPKTHAARLQDASTEDAVAITTASQRLCIALADATGDPDTTVAINNGPAAGQEVQHLHVHLVPRAASDGFGPIHALFPQRPDVAPDELAALAGKVRAALEATPGGTS